MKAIEVRDTWLLELVMRGASINTLEIYKRNTNEAFEYIAKASDVIVESLTIETITRDVCIACLGAYKSRVDGRTGRLVERSGNSVLAFYTALNAFFGWCVITEKITKSPLVSIKAPKVGGRVPKALPLVSCAKLIEVAKTSQNPERDTLAVGLALMMGFRLSELADIKLSQFSPDLQNPTHLVTRGKGDKERSVPVPSPIRLALPIYLIIRENKLQTTGAKSDSLLLSKRETNGSLALSSKGLGQIFDALVKKAGIKAPGIRTHMARHSFATHLLASGSSDLMEVKELLGHSSVATTQIYLKVDPERLSAGVQANPLAGL